MYIFCLLQWQKLKIWKYGMVEGVRKLTLSKKGGRHGKEQKLVRATWEFASIAIQKKIHIWKHSDSFKNPLDWGGARWCCMYVRFLHVRFLTLSLLDQRDDGFSFNE